MNDNVKALDSLSCDRCHNRSRAMLVQIAGLVGDYEVEIEAEAEVAP